MRTQKEEYIERTEREIKDVSATIDEFEGRASRTPAGDKTDFLQGLRDLKEKRDLLSTRLREFRNATDDVLKESVETAKHDLANAFATARDTFKHAA